MTKKKNHILKLVHYNRSVIPAVINKIEQPYWESIQKVIKNTFEYGGGIWLEVIQPEDAYIHELHMYARPHLFRLTAFTRDKSLENEFLEWWDPNNTLFKGKIPFGIKEYDARTVSNDIHIAEEVFYGFYEEDCYKKLNPEIFKNFYFSSQIKKE